MDKNSITGIILIVLIFLFFSWWNQPSEQERVEMQRKHDSVAAAVKHQREIDSLQNLIKTDQNKIATVVADSVEMVTGDVSLAEQEARKGKFGVFANSSVGEEEHIQVESDLVNLVFTNRGARIYKAQLKKYQTSDSLPLILFEGDTARFGFVFNAANRLINTQEHFFKVFINGQPYNGNKKISIGENDSVYLAFRLYPDAGNGFNESQYIEFNYNIKGNNYMFDVKVHFVGLENIVDNRNQYFAFNWQQNLRTQEPSVDRYNGSGIYYRYTQDDVDNLKENSDEKESLKGKLQWISFKQRFFSSTIIADDYFMGANVEQWYMPSNNPKYQITMGTDFGLPVDNVKDFTVGMKMYLGPNEFKGLKAYGMRLERQIPIGWGFFLLAWINEYIVINVFHYLGGLGWNYGIVILVLTILLKLVLFPIAYKTYKSSAKMRVLKPEIDEINEKFKDKDAVKKQQATMDLYKKAGVNPMAGCVPMLLQMPILFAMFRFFPSSIELRQKSFLWAHDLSSYDSIFSWTTHIPILDSVYGNHISLFTLLMTISTVIYTKVNNDMMGSSSQQMPGMKTMMYIMPIMFLGIFNNYASGLSYYYFLANMITFGQMYLIRKTINDKKIHAQIEANKKKPAKKKSGFQKRLEEMAKQQQQQQQRKR